jgi:uncharacterized membrane protein
VPRFPSTGSKTIPETLHWFKWEAYFTWVTGIVLLVLVYYAQANSFLLDPSVAKLSQTQGIGIGVGTLFFGWIVYDLFCKSFLSKNSSLFFWLVFVFISAVGFGLT